MSRLPSGPLMPRHLLCLHYFEIISLPPPPPLLKTLRNVLTENARRFCESVPPKFPRLSFHASRPPSSTFISGRCPAPRWGNREMMFYGYGNVCCKRKSNASERSGLIEFDARGVGFSRNLHSTRTYLTLFTRIQI